MVYLKEEEIHRNPLRGEGHIKMEAEIGGMHIQTRDCWEPLEANKQDFPTRAFRRSQAFLTV